MDQGDLHPGVPQRPPASAWVNIDSEDRYKELFNQIYNPTPANDFRIQKAQPLLYGIFKRVGVSQIQLQYRVPTIVAGVNDTFVLWDSTNNDYYQVTLDPGFYSATTLAAEIQTKVLAIPANPFTAFTCVYNTFAGGLAMTNTAVDMALSATYNPGPLTATQLTLFERTLETLGGFIQPPALAFATGTPKLLYTRYIDIVSDRLAKFQRVKDADTLPTNKSNIVARVYLTAPNTRVDPSASGGPFDLTWDPNTPKHSMWSMDEAIYELDFRLYDERGDLLYWTPGFNTEFQVSILASET